MKNLTKVVIINLLINFNNMQTVVNFEITDKKIQELQKLFEKFKLEDTETDDILASTVFPYGRRYSRQHKLLKFPDLALLRSLMRMMTVMLKKRERTV